MKNGRTMFKLFLSYILLVIPMVLVSFFVTNTMISGLRKRTDQRIDTEIFQIEQKLNDQWVINKDNAVKITSIDQLSPDKFASRGDAVRQGIEYLGNIKMMDTFLDEILLCYEGGIFTSKGYCRPETYLGITLDCDADQVDLGKRILQYEQETMVYLSSPDGGYLLFHYPVQSGRRVVKGENINSINYCVESEKIYSLLETMMEQMNFVIHITFENEWQKEDIFLRRDMDAEIDEIDAEAYELLQSEGDWVVREVNLEVWGMKLIIAYDAEQLYEQVKTLQQINMLSMGVLLLCSILISYGISKNQYDKIYQLRKSLQTAWHSDTNGVQKNLKNEFDYMHIMIQSIIQDTGRMRQETDNARKMMRQQGAMLLFYGGIREESVALGMLESCGLEMQEPFFSVVCITPADGNDISLKRFGHLLEEKLSCTGNVGGRNVIILLLEMSSEDFGKRQRQKFADAVFAETTGRVKIAFSRPYENILRASGAYLEAAGICERLQQTADEYFGYADTWIDVRQKMVQFKEAELTELENAISDEQKQKAQIELGKLFEFLRTRTLTEENKKYLRYSIIQSMLLGSKNMECQNERIIAEEIAGIDLNDEITFNKKMEKALDQIFPADKGEERKKIDFARVVEYIGKNYYRYDLSLEEVADFAGLSKAYMSRLFKEKTGSKYIEYLTACRMEQAKRLLLETDMSVKEISEAVGYCNVPGFRNKFKSHFGINASEIRRKFRTAEEKGEE